MNAIRYSLSIMPPMLKTLRTFLIWLLMLAIPAQGVAAATMLYCGPVHQPAGAAAMQHAGHAIATVAAAVVHSASPDTHTHQGHDMSGHVDHAVQDADASGATAQAAVAGVPDLSQNVKCSVCATCCSPAGMTSSVMPIPSLPASSAPLLLAPALVFDFITDGPQRPPRSFLA